MLRKASLHVTRPRIAVLAAVHDHPHADTESIIGFVRDFAAAWVKVMNLDRFEVS